MNTLAAPGTALAGALARADPVSKLLGKLGQNRIAMKVVT
jgi:hypothetical protein